MKAIQLIRDSFLWYAVSVTAPMLVICGLVCLIRSILARRDRKITVAAGLVVFVSFVLFLILMDCSRFVYLAEPDPRYQPFQLMLFAQPWVLYAILEGACAVILVLLFLDDCRYRRSHLTPDAVRETVDLLPEGICISAPDGTVLLSNLQMDGLCRTLTGSVLTDAVRFRQQIETIGERQNEAFLVHMPDGKTWRFLCGKLTEKGKTYDRTTAMDVTELCCVAEELREKNDRLQEIQRRMKAVSDLSGEMFTAQEEADARAALHNQLGQVLLMGRHTLEHPDSTDAELVRMATLEMNRFLLREAEAPSESQTDRFQQSLALAKSIGVQTEILGSLPENPAYRALLAQAVQECAANAVKHAEGDRLVLRPEENEKEWSIRITNNGRPPRGPVTESGGLLSLRRHTEAAGGAMTVESSPAFALVLRLPAITGGDPS
jgi:signal transduction histidine kinase